MAVEISTTFSLKEIKVETPLERTNGYKLLHDVVLIPVLRAVRGPALIEQVDATLLVSASFVARVDPLGSYVLTADAVEA